MTIEARLNKEAILNYEEAKELMFVRVRNIKDVPMETAPATVYGDLALTYHIALRDEEEEIATAMIGRELMRHYGIRQETLHEAALKNAARLYPACIGSLTDIIELKEKTVEFDPESIPEAPILILTNKMATFGASALFYPGVKESLGKALGNYFILPSSVHEVLILRDDGAFGHQELQMIVQSINRFEVDEDEQLSDMVYHYEAETGILEPAEEFAKRCPGTEGKCS